MIKKWLPALRIFTWEILTFYLTFVVTLIGYVLYRAMMHPNEVHPGWLHNDFLMGAFVPFLIGTSSMAGSFLGMKKNVPDKSAQKIGSIIFAIINLGLFWPDRNESYFTLVEGVVLSFVLLLFFLRNLRGRTNQTNLEKFKTTSSKDLY